MSKQQSYGCTSYGGKPKRVYATKADAEREAAKHNGWRIPYECKAHSGWDLGGVVSRALRTALGKR